MSEKTIYELSQAGRQGGAQGRVRFLRSAHFPQEKTQIEVDRGAGGIDS